VQKTWKYIHNVYSSISYSWNFCFISMNKKKFPLKFWTARPQITKIDSLSLFVFSVSLNFFYCSSKIRNSRSWMRWAFFFNFHDIQTWRTNTHALSFTFTACGVHRSIFCADLLDFVKWSDLLIVNWFLRIFSYYTVWFHD